MWLCPFALPFKDALVSLSLSPFSRSTSKQQLSSLMAAAVDNRKNLLRELDVLSQALYQAHNARRTHSLDLPRSSDTIPADPGSSLPSNALTTPKTRPRPRRLSMSALHSGQQPDTFEQPAAMPHSPLVFTETATSTESEKKGIWSWKPLRALSHIGMHRLAILLSVEVVAVQSLPTTMNGLRLSVVVRKKETKEGAVQTMPVKVFQGAADFDETLFIHSHIFYSGSGSTGKPLRLEPRPFFIFPIAIDAPDLNLGRSSVDLSLLVKESMERSFAGSRVQQWDSAFKLSGKARGGELVFKLGFKIMEEGGVGVYRQASDVGARSFSDSSSFLARRQSRSSFSISSPRGTRSAPTVTPSKGENSAVELKGIKDFDLDEEPTPAPLPPPPKSQLETEPRDADNLELHGFEVIDRGIESRLGEERDLDAASSQAANEASSSTSTSISASVEVVKKVVHNSAHSAKLMELDSIAKQIKALELKMTNDEGEEKSDLCSLQPEGTVQQLNADEETTTREFLQILELEDDNGFQQLNKAVKPGPEAEATGYLPDLGKGLGPIVQTKDGGFLASMNPFDVEVPKIESPKLAMQISRPIIIDDGDKPLGDGGFIEVFQNLAEKGLEELESKLLSLTSMDELVGKTAEQIAFEGIASTIIGGRNRELAKSAAARSIATLKSIALEMNEGRKERIAAGIWNVREEPLASVEEALSFSLQKMEAMALEALKLQAGVAEEEAPFDVSPLGFGGRNWLLDYAVPLEDWLKKGSGEGKTIILMVLVQLRDPLRQFEAVGAPMIAMVQAARVDGEEEECYKVRSLHIGGMRLSSGRKMRSIWDGERQRLTAMQWAVGYGMGKAGKRRKTGVGKGKKDVIWSLSSRIMADMWLKLGRNPDVKFLHL